MMETFTVAGHAVWKDQKGTAQVRFIGKGGAEERGSILRAIEPDAPPIAWARQIHSAHHLPAQVGFCGEGDALITDQPGVALSVITADCVPVLLAGPAKLAAVHAGWRGIVSRIVEHTLTALAEPPADLTAWIGPSIGACCYEVGDDVARQVIDASTPAIATPGPASPTGKPHLNLIAAVTHQLTALGVGQIHPVERCTRCHPDELASYRREGRGAGRNLAVVWRD